MNENTAKVLYILQQITQTLDNAFIAPMNTREGTATTMVVLDEVERDSIKDNLELAIEYLTPPSTKENIGQP